MKKLDEYVASCSCGWFIGRIFYSGRACQMARHHVNRTRTPGHTSYAFNMTRLECVAKYRKWRPQSESLLDQPPF